MKIWSQDSSCSMDGWHYDLKNKIGFGGTNQVDRDFSKG